MPRAEYFEFSGTLGFKWGLETLLRDKNFAAACSPTACNPSEV